LTTLTARIEPDGAVEYAVELSPATLAGVD